jgi:hypothetical protein
MAVRYEAEEEVRNSCQSLSLEVHRHLKYQLPMLQSWKKE